MTQIKLSAVMKKDFKVLGYLVVFGGTTILANKYLQTGDLSVVFGAAVNYVLFRIDKELKNQGYKNALTK